MKAVVERKEPAWKVVLGGRDEIAKEKMHCSFQRRKVTRCIYQRKKGVIEMFGKKMNQDVNGNTKLFWREASKVNGRKIESCSRIKDSNRRLKVGDYEVQRIWMEYYEDLYNIDTQEQVAVTNVWLQWCSERNTLKKRRLGEIKGR